MLKLFQGKDGKLNMVKIIVTLILVVGLAWLGAALFGGNTSNYAVVKKNREKLEIITSIPSTPVSKVPLKALGVLQRNNHRRSLPGFDIEGADMPN